MQKEISTRYIYTRESGDYFVSLPTVLNRRVRDFRAEDYDSPEKAHKAAVAWRDRHLPATQRNLTVRQNKTGQRLLGMADGRVTSMGKLGVVYSVSSQVNGRSRPINFVVGREAVVTPQQEQFTLDIATRCRQAFERAWDAGEPFDPSPWKGRKQKYGFAAV